MAPRSEAPILVDYLGNPDVNLYLPCKAGELGQELDSNTITITRVIHPEELSMLKGMTVNIDELNFLAQAMTRFDQNEETQFLAAASLAENVDVKDLINISLNTSHYTVINSFCDLAGAGKQHLKNLGAQTSTLEHEEFVEAGKQLLISGRGIPTSRGLLFENEEVPFETLYDGNHLPWYRCRNDIIAGIQIRYGGGTEYLYLPEESFAIDRALERLGCPVLADCSVEFDVYGFNTEKWKARLDSVLEKEGLYGANRLTEALSRHWMNQDKLLSVVEFAQAEGSEDIKRLADHFDDFMVLDHARTAVDVAKYFVAHEDGYRVDGYARAFVDFQRMGEAIIANREGQFVGDGFVCMEKGKSLEQIMEATTPGMELAM